MKYEILWRSVTLDGMPRINARWHKLSGAMKAPLLVDEEALFSASRRLVAAFKRRCDRGDESGARTLLNMYGVRHVAGPFIGTLFVAEYIVKKRQQGKTAKEIKDE